MSEFICSTCVGDVALRQAVDLSRRRKCTYCGEKKVHGIPIEELAAFVGPKIEELCEWYEDDGGYGSRYGSSYDLTGFLEDELSIPYEAADALAKELISSDHRSFSRGEEPFYSQDYHYGRKELWGGEYHDLWEEFSYSLKHKERFFSSGARSYLAKILGEPGDDKSSALPVFKIGANERVKELWRARRADTEEAAQKFLVNPPKELGPPPVHLATAGRMNPQGIVVFYGAISAATAIAEIRPFVGSYVVVSSFKPLRDMRLLDLTQLGGGYDGSMFQHGYCDRVSRRRFLESFHELITKPILPHEESMMYVPTQVMAEYVANVLGFDGILYASVQVGGGNVDVDPDERGPCELSDEELAKHNVVLFNAASVVKPLDPTAPVSVVDHRALFLEPQMEYVEHSAQVVKVSSVLVSYQPVFVEDPRHPAPHGTADLTDNIF